MIEIVNGTIIGKIEDREYYKFYSEKDGCILWDAGLYENDTSAIKAFFEKFDEAPLLLNQLKMDGIEMRAWKN